MRDVAKNETYVSRILPTIGEDYLAAGSKWIVEAVDELGAFAAVDEVLKRRDKR
jgi:hypothetical protein